MSSDNASAALHVLEALKDVEADPEVGHCWFRHRWSSWVLVRGMWTEGGRPVQARHCRRCGLTTVRSTL